MSFVFKPLFAESSFKDAGNDAMNKNLKAIYENGILRPLEPLSLREHQRVTVMIMDDREPLSEKKNESLYDIAFRNGMLGIIDDKPADLSTNLTYFEGFGCDSSPDPC